MADHLKTCLLPIPYCTISEINGNFSHKLEIFPTTRVFITSADGVPFGIRYRRKESKTLLIIYINSVCGANYVFEANHLWGETPMEQNIYGAKCPSLGRSVHGAKCLWGEESIN